MSNIEERLDYLPNELVHCLNNSTSSSKKLPKSKIPAKLHASSSVVKLEANKSILPIEQLQDNREIELRKMFPYEEKKLIDTKIPTKYFMKKEETIKFIHYADREMLSFEECDNNQILFPTLAPVNRYEVKCLESTLYKMLEDANNPDQLFKELSVDSDGDVIQLIQLVDSMHSIYSLVVYELARQVYTASEDRGQTIMNIQEKYSELARRIPYELNLLKKEVKDQIARDDNLKLKIEEFQESIRYLTNELREVKERDIKVTKSAEYIQRDLENALYDSARSKELLNEYHVLYELQRQRLENQMSSINMEKEEWTNLTFALSLKITDETMLNTSRRLRLCTKQVIQMAHHFTIFISDRDTQLTTKLQELADQCLKSLTKVHTKINGLNNNFLDLFQFIKNKFKYFQEHELQMSKNKINTVTNQIHSLRGFFVEDSMKLFIAESSADKLEILSNELKEARSMLENLMQETQHVMQRSHLDESDNSADDQLKFYENSFEAVSFWLNQFENQLTTAKSFQLFFSDFTNRVDTLETQINSIATKFAQTQNEELILEEIAPVIDDLYIESFNQTEFDDMTKNYLFTEFNQFYSEFQKNTTQFCSKLDQLDAELIEHVNLLQDSVTRWLIEALFLLTNLKTVNNVQEKFNEICQSFELLMAKDMKLYQYLNQWTEKMAEKSGDSELKSIELKEYLEENNQWKEVAEILIKDIEQKIEEEIFNRKKKSEKFIENIKYSDIDEILAEIQASTTEKDIYLALETVTNLKDEVKDIFKRIEDANLAKADNKEKSEEVRAKILEMEQKMADLTHEYQEFIKQ